MRKINKIVCGLAITLLFSCASVPKQVVDAVQLQKTEIARIKTIYFENMNNQLDAIEKYRYAILDIYEKQLMTKYSTSMIIETKDNKSNITEQKPTGNKNKDYVNIGILEDLQKFFKNERETVKNDIQNRREQINLINKNFENIEKLNNALDDYMQSIKRLSNSQDKLAQSIANKIQKIVPIPIGLTSLPDLKTIEDIIKITNK
jgi:hypothetical protein